MKMYAVTQVVLSGEDGTISMQSILGVESKKKAATALMRQAYDYELKQRKLEDNNAVGESDEAVPGGYFTDEEAGIYDYVDFAFGQLLEVVSFVVSEIEVPLRDIQTEKDLHKEMSLRGQRPVLLLPMGNNTSLEPGKEVYAVDHKQALNSNGRLYSLSEKEVFKATILSVKYTDENEFFVEVLAERALSKGGTGCHGCIKEYKLGVDAFLSEHEAKKSLAGKGCD